jgi:bifunctional oligoribonuclease and PAP phosphatase NrnA
VTARNGNEPAWMDDLDPSVLEHATKRLREVATNGETVVIAAHVGPDGDALGAALAMHLVLSRMGAHTLPTVGEQPLKVPAPLAVLPGVGDLVDGGSLPRAEDVALLITVDAASPSRLGSVAGYLDAGVPTLVLDHHASATSFGDLRLIAPRAAATVQIVEAVLDRLQVPLTVDVATCLYAGLVTDTGRFGHASTDASAMELGARLLSAGVDHAELTRRLYDTRSLGELRLLGRALDRAAFVPDVALIHTHLTHDELARAGSGLEATEALIDLLRSADIAEVALVLKPGPEGEWRGSLRSRGAVDVGRIAAAFGGGGHAVAAGFSATGDAQDLVEQIAAMLRGA